MRRQRGEGSVFQRSDGRWVAVLDLGYRDGKRRRKAIYGPTQKAVLKKLNDAKRDVHAHGDIPTAGMTVEAWLTKWLAEVCPTKRRIKPRSLKDYRDKVRLYLIPAVGRTRLDKLTPAHVRQVHKFVTDQGLSTTTARGAHRVLSNALNDAMREGVATRNVAALVSAPPKAPSGRRSLSIPEAVALMRHVAGDRYGSRWLAALLLGARQGELLGLEWSRVDLETGTADLSWQLQRVPYKHACGKQAADKKWPCGRRTADRCPQRELDTLAGLEFRQLDGNLCLQRPKTVGSIRLTPLPDPLVTALRTRWEQYLEERPTYATDHGLVWPRWDGRPTDGRTDWAAWKTNLEAVGIPEMTQHEARHTTATLLLALGVPQEIIMSILGHSDAVTTRGYQHVDLSLQRAALAQLAGKITEA